jgi:hypothetical protein
MRLGKGMLLAAACAAACNRPHPGTRVAPSAAVIAPAVSDAGLSLSASKVKAFMALEEKEQALGRRLAAETANLDGGVLPWMEAHQDRVERAREESGLSSAELQLLQQMSAAILPKRAYVKQFGFGQKLKRMQELVATLPEAERAPLEKTVARMSSEEDALVRLTGERQRFGSRNVDLFLQEEDSRGANPPIPASGVAPGPTGSPGRAPTASP